MLLLQRIVSWYCFFFPSLFRLPLYPFSSVLSFVRKRHVETKDLQLGFKMPVWLYVLSRVV